MAGRCVAMLILILPFSLFGQSNRYFVSFKDKANTLFSVSNPGQFLSQKSIDRRKQENFQVSVEDFPVNPSYVQQVKAIGASVFFTSRWFNGALVQTDPATSSTIAALPFVSTVELVAPGTKLIGGRQKSNQKFERTTAATAVQNQQQLQMIGLDKMQAAGFMGEGIDVAIFDGGFIGVNTLSAFQPIFAEGRLKDAFNFVINSTDVYSAYDHGTEVFSIIAGVASSSYLGGAPKANFFLYQTEDAFSEYRVEEYNWLFAAERADSAGVDVINSSLGYDQFDDPSMDYTYKDLDGKTSVVSRAASKAVDRGISVVNSAGNEGDTNWKYIVVPADAEGVIACGSVDYSGYRSAFSSIGPTADGRIKPDVSALGDGSVLILSTGSVGTGDGTSFSSPLVAGLAIGLRQAFPNASAKEIYSRIINSASQVSHPDDQIGYGIPNFVNAQTLTSFDDEFELYPNPVTNNVLKLFMKDPQGQTVNIVIFNSAGQKLTELSEVASWDNNPYQIALPDFTSGLYYVRVQTPTAGKTNRIVMIK